MIKFEVFSEEHDVRAKLDALGLNLDGLIEVADAAFAARDGANENYPVNSPGTLAYHEGTAQLRVSFLSDSWKKARVDGVECIENEQLQIRVVFSNVDQAADLEVTPKPITDKGQVTQVLCDANSHQTSMDFGDEFEVKEDNYLTYYMFVGEDGTAELSLPLACPSGKFKDLVERIVVLSSDDLDDDFIDDDEDDDGPEIEIEINRKI